MQQTNNNSTAWALTLLLAMFLQVAFVFADASDTPAKAAVEVSKAYFRLDPAMAERICEERLVVDDVNVVDLYLEQIKKEAELRGFEIGMMKKGPGGNGKRQNDAHGDHELPSDAVTDLSNRLEHGALPVEPGRPRKEGSQRM